MSKILVGGREDVETYLGGSQESSLASVAQPISKAVSTSKSARCWRCGTGVPWSNKIRSRLRACRWSGNRQALFGVTEHGMGLFPADTGKPREKLIEACPA